MGCHTPAVDEKCFNAVTWAMNDGIRTHPDWYPGLDGQSAFEDFQSYSTREDMGLIKMVSPILLAVVHPAVAHRSARGPTSMGE